MGTRAGGRRTGPKCIAIVGPFASGKTTLLEAILARTGAIPRQNPVSSGSTVSDHSAEARAHAMSVEATFATTEFMGEQIPALQLIMRKLDDLGVPRILFLNKVDKAIAGVRDTLKMLQPASSVPLLLRQIPLRKDGVVIGSIDLALERAYIYREYAESQVADIPSDDKARELEARFS
ncbi:MAG: elongation factor G, partial [Mesorhizobium sp.]